MAANTSVSKIVFSLLIILIPLILTACSEKTPAPEEPGDKTPAEVYTPITKGWDFSKGDAFIRTDTLKASGKGIEHVVVGTEGNPSLIQQGTGVPGSQTIKCLATSGKTNRYIYFNINKQVLGNMPPGYGTPEKDGYNVDIVVEYFDSGTDSLTIQYNGLDEIVKKPGYWPESRYCVKTNSQKWKRFVFHLIRASFSDGMEGCDLRIDNNGDGDEYIGSVSVLKPKLYIGRLNYTTFHGNGSSSSYDLIRDAQLGVRNDLNWLTVESGQDIWTWNSTDQFINDLLGSRGLFSIPILCYNAPWSAGPGSVKKTAVKTDSNRQDYGDYVYHVVERYGKKVKSWEIWNEPMFGGFWYDGTPTDYVHMLAVAYQRAKEADPTCFVISGGMVSVKHSKYNYEPFPTLREAVRSGLNWSCNGWGLHSNDGTKKPETAITNHISLKLIVDSLCAMPTCQTENYVAASDADVLNRGKLTVRHNILQRAKIGCLSYGIYPKGTYTESDGTTTYGLLDQSGNIRDPYFTEIKVWAARMRKTLFNSDLKAAGRSDADHAYEFKVMQTDGSGAWISGTAPAGTVIVVWNSGTTTRNVFINGLSTSFVNFCNLDGSGQSTLSPSGGRINISNLGDSPKYIWY